MAEAPEHRAGDEPTDRRYEPFADLRRHNAYAARAARLLQARSKPRVDRVIQVQRKHRIHQAR